MPILKKISTSLPSKAAKTTHVDGFRKGKVPVAIIKKMYGEKLTQDAESEAIRTILDQLKKSSISKMKRLSGDPNLFKKY